MPAVRSRQSRVTHPVRGSNTPRGRGFGGCAWVLSATAARRDPAVGPGAKAPGRIPETRRGLFVVISRSSAPHLPFASLPCPLERFSHPSLPPLGPCCDRRLAPQHPPAPQPFVCPHGFATAPSDHRHRRTSEPPTALRRRCIRPRFPRCSSALIPQITLDCSGTQTRLVVVSTDRSSPDASAPPRHAAHRPGVGRRRTRGLLRPRQPPSLQAPAHPWPGSLLLAHTGSGAERPPPHDTRLPRNTPRLRPSYPGTPYYRPEQPTCHLHTTDSETPSTGAG